MSLGGIVITSLKGVLSLSSGILLVAGIGSGCFASETNTASSVLGNLLKTTAGAIEQNKTNQAQPATLAPAETASSTDATALPIFDDPVSDDKTKSAMPVTSVTAETSVLPASQPVMVSQPVAASQPAIASQPVVPSAIVPAATQPATVAPVAPVPLATAQTAVTPVVVATQAVPASVTTGQQVVGQAAVAAPVISGQPTTAVQNQEAVVATIEAGLSAKKKVGFVSQNGMVLIAPDDMVFPNEMRDGEMYFFSRDIDTLKKKITSGEMALPTQLAAPQATVQVAPPQVNAALPAPAVPASPGVQASTSQNDCPGCHIWLKSAI